MPEEEAHAITITLDGETYTLRAGELSALDAKALRRATGMSLRAVMQAAADDPDIDVIAALVWLARRAAGEHELPYEVVAAGVTYGSDFGPTEPAAEDPSDPSS